MRITRIDTVRTDEFPNLVHVLVHTDEELTGLGETFFFADAVEAHTHDVIADYLLGEDPSQIERHAGALRGYVGSASSGATAGSSSPTPPAPSTTRAAGSSTLPTVRPHCSSATPGR